MKPEKIKIRYYFKSFVVDVLDTFQMYGHLFCVHNRASLFGSAIMLIDDRYFVTEYSTGCRIGEGGETIESAIANTKKLLRKAGKEKFKKAMARNLRKYKTLNYKKDLKYGR